MALLSQLDKTKLTSEIGAKLQNEDIQNSGTLTITVTLTAGTTSETTITDNSWTVQTGTI